ncbi:hypothetical protein ACHAW6_004124, partial [Cyclotella cf. meneghiniana]
LYAPSEIYKFNDLIAALSIVSSDGIGAAGSKFYLGEDGIDLGWEYGLVNLAAFLAQCMKETILYDACDENNWVVLKNAFITCFSVVKDLYNDQYPLSNACGQLGQSYQDYNCPAGEEHMQCSIDPTMQITATTHATWYGAPSGFFCAPKTIYPFTGFWDYTYWCDNPWNDPPEYCDVYEGQKSGRFDNTVAVANRAGRSDVEGCCWWGRGVIQTTGICNYGKLNYYLGAKAAQDGRSSRYPDIDFCKTPDAICADSNHPELKWIAGFFYWMESVQNYDKDGWHYVTELHKFVNGGMSEMSFIDSVSGIVNRGCHNPPCATGEVDGLLDRRANFESILAALALPSVGIGERPPSTLPPFSSSSNVPPVPIPSTATPDASSPMSTQLIDELKYKQEILEEKVLSYQNISSLKYGLVNLAAFLSQSITESIYYNACEEFHLDSIGTKYAISNSCGQFGNSYQDYTCDGSDAGMECPVLSSMNLVAVGDGKYNLERPSFYCRSKALEPFTGVFDSRSSTVVNDAPYPNAANRTDVEGCCFWGRGALMTKGVCMLGKLNYYLGSRAAREGRMAMYPEIDFCSNPDAICKKTNASSGRIVWDIALFEWVERIQSYNYNGWNYIDQLHQFVDGGQQDVSFINTVSEILTGAIGSDVPFTGRRWANFNLLLTYLQLKDETDTTTYSYTSGKKNIRNNGWFSILVAIAGVVLLN